MNDFAFRSTTHGSRDVKLRGFRGASGYDEGLERLQLVVARIYGALELRDARVVDTRLGQLCVHLLDIWSRQKGADREQIALYSDQYLIHTRHGAGSARGAQNRVQLINVTIGIDARVILGNPAATEQSSRARVAGLRIDLHSHIRVNFATMEHEIKDVTILGAGPTGLFGLFYCGMRGASAQVIDALSQSGGQLTALYPEKYIFDVAGFPKVLAKDLVRALEGQAAQFGEPVHLNQHVTALEEHDGHFVLVTETDRFPTRSLVLAAGIGAFSPRRLPQAVAEPWYGRGIQDRVLDPEQYRGKRVIIIGGGDSAFDWAQQLRGTAEAISLVHRSDRFRAHAATVADVLASVDSGKTKLFTFHELHDIQSDGDYFHSVTLRHVKSKELAQVECDVILPMLGFVSDLGALAEWGLKLENDEIIVNSQMETGRAGIYSAGDICMYPGKLKLIATGFAEAATAVNQAVHWVYPDKKVAPGHSSNMAVFGQKDD